MKIFILSILNLLLTFSVIAQNGFQKGYFIENAENKVECFIKNVDWKNNPSSFKYKLTEDGQEQILTIKEVKEFGIQNFSIYKRFTVKLDRASNRIEKLSYKREPNYEVETIFLRTIIKGKANLYVFESNNVIQYFYQNEGQDITNLVYKRYRFSGSNNLGSNKILENTDYKFQLFKELNCGDNTPKDIKNLKYIEKNLIKYFTAYNKCSGSNTKNFSRKKGNNLSISFRPGLNVTSFEHRRVGGAAGLFTGQIKDLGTAIHARIGFELEVLLPFNNKRWSLFLEPTFTPFNIEKEISERANSASINLIEIPFGLRHYFPVVGRQKLFLNLGLSSAFVLKAEVTIDNILVTSRKINGNLFLGIGYSFNNKIGLEYRYTIARDALGNFRARIGDLTTMSFIFSYKLL